MAACRSPKGPMMRLVQLLLGPRLRNEQYAERKISAFEAVPAMGLDGLGSSSYGPEAALTVLAPVGAAGLAYIGYVMVPILVLMAILYISYRQTVRAYPSNGGAYTVSKENLGANASLVAASALTIDYVLNVAVGISAGVGALTSALPPLQPYTLWLCLAILALVTYMNLRGTIDAGRAWALPTYVFVASFLAVVAIGLYQTWTSGGHPQPVVRPPKIPKATEVVSLWLLLRAFAAGCTAMTGVEAVSNGVGAFREPAVKRAHHTLGAICLILSLLLAGITYLAGSYGIAAMDQSKEGYQSVLSQLAGAVAGHGIFYYVALASALAILCLSANTSFVDFPRVCRLLAQDDYLPRPFATVGRRLVYPVGIVYLGVTGGLLLAVFDGITDRLIPLFAIGAFLTFTMSQLGMVFHWRRELKRADGRDRHRHRVSLAINAVGASTTAVALAIIILAKFTEGAWITILAIPSAILLLRQVKGYYANLDAQLEDTPLSLDRTDPPLVLIVTERWNRMTDRALQFGLRISPDVVAVHMTNVGGPDVHERRRTLRRRWAEQVEAPAKKAGIKPPQLVLLEANYRRIQGPLLKFVAATEKSNRDRLIAVLIPEIVKEHWWQYLLHSYRAQRLRACLLRYGGSRLVVINVPWYLEEPRPEQGLEPEEIALTAGNKPSAADNDGEAGRQQPDSPNLE
jgi:amino acid transporter